MALPTFGIVNLGRVLYKNSLVIASLSVFVGGAIGFAATIGALVEDVFAGRPDLYWMQAGLDLLPSNYIICLTSCVACLAAKYLYVGGIKLAAIMRDI